MDSITYYIGRYIDYDPTRKYESNDDKIERPPRPSPNPPRRSGNYW